MKIEQLLEYRTSAKLSIIPVRIGGDKPKSPKIHTWKKYQSELPSEDNIKKWFANSDDNTGVALICGEVSGNVEVIDIDNHLGNAQDMFESIIELLQSHDADMLNKLVIQKTQSGGYHIIYRREDEVPKNHKLAKKKVDDKEYTLIETRGEGGYALIHPSPLYHLISLTNQKNSITNIQKISAKQCYFLHHFCKSFDDTDLHVSKEEQKEKTQNKIRLDEGLRAGDDFNSRASIEEIIIPHGWQLVGQTGRVQHWTRPGKDKGVSATYNYIPDTFWVFSTNAHPLESDRKYDKFGLWTALNVGSPDDTNNMKKAASVLGKKGYGSIKIQNGLSVGILEKEHKPAHHTNGTSHQTNTEVSFSAIKKMTVAEKNEFIENWLNERYMFRYNIVKGYVEFSPHKKFQFEQLTDKYTNQFWRDLMKENITTTRTYLDNLIDSGFSKDYHPFKEFFKNLPEWDGEDHIGNFISLVKVDKAFEQLWNKYFTKWIVATVATALGKAINHTCLVLKGGQGIGKTTIINRLVPPELQEYYATTQITPQDKDSKLLLTDSFIINLDELESSTRNEVGHLKSLMTLDQVTARRPYGRRAEILKRRASFIASVNRTNFLSDLTGNRRFLVVEVKSIDFRKDFDIYQLYAQALYLFYNDFEFFFNEKEIAEINAANKQFEMVRAEEELILKYFEPAEVDESLPSKELVKKFESVPYLKLMTASELKDFFSKKSSVNTNTTIIGQLLTNLGFVKKFIKLKGNTKQVYFMKQIDDDDDETPAF